ncbi:hypothetical protein Taro_013738 [Colocasia esculenta]|uniref:Uncharacterized protein n=1 Tax=Colocasia esculenta TaxID=4460 RepID=A0A843UCJ2_COLES|nr:hypothetical protein [Colocasia esculenta]
MQICSLKQEQSVRRLKTFVVTHQRKEKRKNARKAAKPILFYKGESFLPTYTEDDFGWENKSNNQLESIQEMADMPEKIKEMCRKQKIPQPEKGEEKKERVSLSLDASFLLYCLSGKCCIPLLTAESEIDGNICTLFIANLGLRVHIASSYNIDTQVVTVLVVQTR